MVKPHDTSNARRLTPAMSDCPPPARNHEPGQNTSANMKQPPFATINFHDLPAFEQSVKAAGGSIAGMTVTSNGYICRLEYPQQDAYAVPDAYALPPGDDPEPETPTPQPARPEPSQTPLPRQPRPLPVMVVCGGCGTPHEVHQECSICSALVRCAEQVRRNRREFKVKSRIGQGRMPHND